MNAMEIQNPVNPSDLAEKERADRIVEAERIFRSIGRAAAAAMRMSVMARTAANLAALQITGIDVLLLLAEAGFVFPVEADETGGSEGDDNRQRIVSWLASQNRPWVRTVEIWTQALGQNEADFDHHRKMYVAKQLSDIGYRRRVHRIDGKQTVTWWRPEASQFH